MWSHSATLIAIQSCLRTRQVATVQVNRARMVWVNYTLDRVIQRQINFPIRLLSLVRSCVFFSFFILLRWSSVPLPIVHSLPLTPFQSLVCAWTKSDVKIDFHAQNWRQAKITQTKNAHLFSIHLEYPKQCQRQSTSRNKYFIVPCEERELFA